MGSPIKTVTILRSFDAYPRGEKEHFHEGQEIEVDEKTASDWKKKGLAKVKPSDESFSSIQDAVTAASKSGNGNKTYIVNSSAQDSDE